MKIHHLNCGSMCPVGGAILPRHFQRGIVCHCLLIEDRDRLILIDTGLGLEDGRDPSRLGPLAWALKPSRNLQLTAFEQVQALGFSPTDVTDIVVTHLDLDHAGGIADFSAARVHVQASELDAARTRSNLAFRLRYRPSHISGAVNWSEFAFNGGEKWKGFDCVREIIGLPPEILLVNLPGHTPGHFGIAIESLETGWLLHAGDAYYDRRELTAASTGLGLRAFQKFAHADVRTALQTQSQLASLCADHGLHMFCSHDPGELEGFLNP